MSLKVFHLVFITLSTLLAWMFGVWCVWSHTQSPNSGLLMMGMVSFVTGAGLIVYERWFVRKMKQARFL